MSGLLEAQTDPMSSQLLDVSTLPATSKRSRSQDSHRSDSSRLTTSGPNGNDHHTNRPTPQPDVKIPAYLNQQRAQISKRFQDLEWHQRFRLQHGYTHPETSPFRMDKSDTVVNRNRYGNVQPWDPSRVKLRTPIDGSDYINASPIILKSQVSRPSTNLDSTPSGMPEGSSPSDKPFEMKYIATQGPKDDQFVHFWHMVMQETVGPVGVVVMLTQCYEGIKEKCSQYFPKDLENPVLVLDTGVGEPAGVEVAMESGDPSMSPRPKSAGTDRLTTDTSIDSDLTGANGKEELRDPAKGDSPSDGAPGVSQEPISTAIQHSGSVTLLSWTMDPQSRCEIRRMRLELGGETKEIYHYLFNGWPDYGKPEGDDRRALLELTRQTRERALASQSSSDKPATDANVNPRFVHCSAGVGRTGTFIALDWLLSQLEQGNLVPKATEQDSNTAAYQENSDVNGSGKTETWGKSGPVKDKESTPEARDGFDLIYDTVNKLREQRMMMVMNEIQYSFLYEVVKEAFVEKYSRSPTVGIVDVRNIKELSSTGEAARGDDVGDGATTPGSQQEDPLSEAETEIEEDPYRAVSPEGIRAEVEGAKGVGAE
jgi:protein-tyrosine phosphatase